MGSWAIRIASAWGVSRVEGFGWVPRKEEASSADEVRSANGASSAAQSWTASLHLQDTLPQQLQASDSECLHTLCERNFYTAILSPQLEVRRQCAHVVLDRPCFESPSLRAPAIQQSRAWAQLAWVNGIASFAGEPELEGEVVLKVRMPACPITEYPDEGCGVPQSSAELPVTWPSEATKVSISPRGWPSPTKKNRQGENSRGWQSGGGSGGSGAWVHSGSTCAKASADLRDQQGPQNLQFRCGHPSEQVICRFANTR